MDVYAINLPSATIKRERLMQTMRQYNDMMSLKFVEAVDCRKLAEDELERVYDQHGAFVMYGRKMLGGEIGCALSHRKCCQLFLESNAIAAMIVEDDLVWQDADLRGIIYNVEEMLSHEQRPMVVLLSGDYWFTTKQRRGNVLYAKVREAVCAHAYMLNRKAAKIIANSPKDYLADDWYNIKQQGVKVLAVFPHIADQNRKDFKTEISPDYFGVFRRNLSLPRMFHSYYRAIVKRLLFYSGHFESKEFYE